LNILHFGYDMIACLQKLDIIRLKPRGIAVEFLNMLNHGVRKEVQQAIIQDWGWASRRSGTFYQLPCYFVANNIQQKDGYSVGYIKYI
jgi:hypothetical protein